MFPQILGQPAQLRKSYQYETMAIYGTISQITLSPGWAEKMLGSLPITHVIYDLDGLLLDTESLIEQINQVILRRFDKTLDALVRSKIAGRSALDSAKILIDVFDLPLTAEEYLKLKYQLVGDIYPQAQPMPGSIHLIQHLYSHHIPQAIATSSSQYPFSLKTKFHQAWISLIDCVVTGDDADVKLGKPAPDIFLVAARRLGANPRQCLVFEDSLAGVSAARAAGMSVIAVPEASMDWQLYQDADQILRTLTEFQPEQWHLPPFESALYAT
jgi:pseudouridine-5'-monophosphatase